jgi:signal transduction histidine kinase/ligand-binding sensor domain-containing protein
VPLPRAFLFRSSQLLLALACSLSLAHGTNSSEYRFDSWTVDHGLPSNWTLGVQQTPDGFLWLITSGGLVRFDGLQFRVFNRANTPALKSTNFVAFGLLVDHEGGLWAGTWQGGAIRYFHGAFTAYTVREGLPNNHVVRIDQDNAGTVWIFTEPGLSTWQNGKITKLAPAPNSPFNPYLSAPLNLGIDSYLYGLWRLSAFGWQRFAYGQWSDVPMPPNAASPRAVKLDQLVEDSQRRIWFKIIGREREIFGVDQGHLTVYRGAPKGSFACYQDRSGRLWITDPGGHAGWWKDGQFTPISGFSTPSLFRVFEDRDHEYWVGTLNEGLFRLTRQEVSIVRLPGGPVRNRIGPVLVDPAGDIWVGTWGITRIREGVFRSFVRKHWPERSFDAQFTTCMYWDRDNSLWLSYPDQLTRFQNGKFQTIPPELQSIHGGIGAILRDKAGDLWLGGEGLYRWHGSTLQRYREVNGVPLGQIRELLADPDGGLWIASDDGLLFFKDDRFRLWKETDGLFSNHVVTLHKDKDGVLWIGTADGGLNRFERGRFQHINVQNGLYSDDIYSILEDRAGFLWLTCRKGISRVRKEELNAFFAGRVTRISSLHLGKTNGFLSVDCRGDGPPRSFQCKDGTLLVSTRNGLAVLHPDRLAIDSRPPPVFIESCSLNGRAVSCQHEIRIHPGQSDLEIQYTAINFSRAEQTHFRYQLAGMDTEWTEADMRRSAVYSHLPPGSYTFRVIAANSDGVWNKTGQSLAILVLPPFYRTWWFVGLFLMAVAGAAVFAWQYRVSQLQRAYTVQEAFSRQLIASQERERKRIAAELHDSLGQQLLIIKNWAVLALTSVNGSESVKEPLDQISDTASHAVEEMREIAYNLRPYQLEKLGLTAAIRGLITRVAASSGIRFVTEIGDVDGLFPQDVEISIYRIVQEALNNILKHSQATEGWVLTANNSGTLSLTIGDNGLGFTPTGDRESQQDSKGFGLLGIAERVRMLGGRVVIQSAPGSGSSMQISLGIQSSA